MASDKTKKIIDLTTILLVAVGVLGALASAYYSEAMTPRAGSFSSAFASTLTTLSIAFLGIALVNFALDTKNWKEYFGERLKEIVVENDYLSTLDQDALKDLQTKLLKAQFKNQSIDKEGGFLNYFHLHLHKYISAPYREDVSTEILMKVDESNDKVFRVMDKVRYVCRASGGEIQPHVGWKPDEGEFERVESLKISVQFPPHHNEPGKHTELYFKNDDKLEADLEKGISVSLENYKDIDGLVVTTEAHYLVRVGQFQYWQMAHPTKNFDITITFPQTYQIQFKTLVLEDVVSQITQESGYLKFGYGTWMLPQSGLTWLLQSKVST